MTYSNPRPKAATASKTKAKASSANIDTARDDIAQLVPTNVIDILHQDHLKVDNLFFQYRYLDDKKEKKQIVDEILQELYWHATVEEELVYPPTAESTDEQDVQDMVDEAYTEHHVVKVVMAELATMKPGDEMYDAKVTVLCELVRHHVHEEEKELFMKLKESDVDLEKLGEQVMARKDELKEEPVSSGIKEIWKELKEFKMP